MTGRGVLLIAALILLAAPVRATAQSAYLRVVDVGAGLCVIAVTPDGHAMLYDAGRGQPLCRQAVDEIVTSDVLDLVVLSHSDSDHVRELVAILNDNRARRIIHPGDPRGEILGPIREAIAEEPGADVWNLSERPVAGGRRFRIGGATATFVAGWSDGEDTRGEGEPSLLSEPAMRNNALSTVIRFEFGGHSVLLTGDTVGRPDSPDYTLCRYAERIMVENIANVPLQSDVLIGQHHGADNATSNCFIRAVRPTFVVFSAGHQHRHPRQSAADRLVAFGVEPSNIFRTDRGDDEGGVGRKREWLWDSLRDCVDKPGDDDVEIHLPSDPDEDVRVAYRTPINRC